MLLHIWRRAMVLSTASNCSGPPAHLTEQHVSVDTSGIAIDYQECNLLADIALTCDDPEQVLQAGLAFDALAEDKTLLYPFPTLLPISMASVVQVYAVSPVPFPQP